MIIYEESKSTFISDVDNNRLYDKLVDSFREKTGGVPDDKKVWVDEYTRFSLPLRNAHVDDEIRVALEYHLYAGGRLRLDVLLAGNNQQSDNALIVELKAWDRAGRTNCEELVLAPYGGRLQPSQHPCVQASKYKIRIVYFNEDIERNDIHILSAAYLFNLNRRNPEPLEAPIYNRVIADSRLFLADDAQQLTKYIEHIVPYRPKKNIMFYLENGKLRPTEELINKVGSMLEGNPEFDLFDKQNEAYQIIRTEIAKTSVSKRRHVFIVKGGPGTGKSVIAVRLLADILKQKRAGFIIAPNAAFRNTIVEYLSKGNSLYRNTGESLFQSSWNFNDIDYDKDLKHEILIIDEAHRLKDKAYRYYGKNMVEDMVRAARISIFFIDETQRIAWNDIGSEDMIKKAAKKYKSKVHESIELTAQFRCNGSTGFLNWLDDVLQIKETGNFDNWGNGEYDFKVFDDAAELYRNLKEKNIDNKARLIAGYSWAWPKEGRRRGTLKKHVQIDSFALPWNYEGENWATSPDGIGQVGCIHTSQGLEFDFIGILVGDDLTYKDYFVKGIPEKRAKTDKSLSGMKSELKVANGNDELKAIILKKANDIIKSTYKVLMTRGKKGCYVWFADKALREYFKHRLTLVSKTIPKESLRKSFQIISDPPSGKFIEFAPIYSLKAAAGSFGAVDPAECNGWIKVTGHKIDGRYFIAEVIGKSMEPLIKPGSFNLFRFGVIGSRTDKIVLAQHNSISDPETGGSYTVKKYTSTKKSDSEQEWIHDQIKLVPLNPDFQPIDINPDNVEEISIVAEWICSIE